MASVRRHQEVPLRWKVSSSGSKVDPPLAKPEAISGVGSTSVVTYFRKSKKILHNSCEREVRKCDGTYMQAPRSVKEEEEEVLQVLEQRLPCSF